MTRRIACVLWLAAACGGKKAEPAKPIDVAAINALVPADLKDKLVFEQRAIVLKRHRHDTTYTVAAPKTWKQESDMFGNLKADDKGGFFSGFSVGSNCDGECKEKDWEKVADKVNFAPHAKDKILKDDKAPGRRTMIAESDTGTKTTTVVTAWWTEGEKSYHSCSATLDESIKAAAPAFEKACAIVNIDGDD